MADERRLVTVLFADVVGSTALGEALDPEDVRALLARLFSIASDAVERHGGRVEKFIGDAIMAVFGLPVAHEDDAARALSAALDLRDRVRADLALGDRVPIRIGVNGGEVIATRDAAASQFLITGDPVNTAARLQQNAETWGILVGERTVGAAGGRFTFGAPVAIEAKGKAQPVMARPLLGLSTQPVTERRGRLVGRDADLEQLELTARRAFEEGRPFLATIVAPAGVGKSRLLEEFVERLAPTARVALAQCLPYGQRLTYWPMRAILLSIVGLQDDASPEEVRDGVVTWLRAAGDPDAERTGGLLSATIGASELETGDRLALFGAWRQLVELAAANAPLVLVIEDLHWSSDSLLDLVESMLQPRADVPLLMVALARPELVDRRPSWGAGRRNAVSISLDPLPDGAVAQLVGDLLPDAPPDVSRAVVARAEGNPFYAGEIVRSVRDQLGANATPEAVETAIAALPDTVHATVLARLDALEPGARRVVQLGAVIGRSFEVGAVAALEPELGAHAIDAAFELLIDRDMIRPGSRGTATFRHILIREVAYGTLPRAERARLHGAAGTWLEQQAVAAGREDELAELVAYHLREAIGLAQLLGEDLAPDRAARAVRWLRRAAEVTFGSGANVEAARHLESAIDLAPRELQPDLYERLGQIWSGGDQGAEAFAKASALGRELDLGPDQQLRTLAQTLIVHTRWVGSVSVRLPREELNGRMDAIERLLEVATEDRAKAFGELAIGFSQNLADRPTHDAIERSRAAAERALELSRRLDDPELISAAFDALDSAEVATNRFLQVADIVRQRLDLGSRLSTGERLDAWIVAAWGATMLGRLDEAEQSAASATSGLASGQAPAWVSGAAAWRTYALYLLGRWDDAQAEAVRMQRAIRESELRAPWFALNGIVSAFLFSRARGDLGAADAWRGVANAIFDRSDPGIRTQRLDALLAGRLDDVARLMVDDAELFTGRQDYVALALMELADERHPSDRAALDQLVAYTEERSVLLVSATARRLRGTLDGDVAELSRALEGLEQMGARPGAARVRAEIGRLQGDHAAVEAAIADLEQIGDVRHATRLVREARASGATGRDGEPGAIRA
jgi:class 3 adenylate cyclase